MIRKGLLAFFALGVLGCGSEDAQYSFSGSPVGSPSATTISVQSGPQGSLLLRDSVSGQALFPQLAVSSRGTQGSVEVTVRVDGQGLLLLPPAGPKNTVALSDDQKKLVVTFRDASDAEITDYLRANLKGRSQPVSFRFQVRFSVSVRNGQGQEAVAGQDSVFQTAGPKAIILKLEPTGRVTNFEEPTQVISEIGGPRAAVAYVAGLSSDAQGAGSVFRFQPGEYTAPSDGQSYLLLDGDADLAFSDLIGPNQGIPGEPAVAPPGSLPGPRHPAALLRRGPADLTPNVSLVTGPNANLLIDGLDFEVAGDRQTACTVDVVRNGVFRGPGIGCIGNFITANRFQGMRLGFFPLRSDSIIQYNAFVNTGIATSFSPDGLAETLITHNVFFNAGTAGLGAILSAGLIPAGATLRLDNNDFYPQASLGSEVLQSPAVGFIRQTGNFSSVSPDLLLLTVANWLSPNSQYFNGSSLFNSAKNFPSFVP